MENCQFALMYVPVPRCSTVRTLLDRSGGGPGLIWADISCTRMETNRLMGLTDRIPGGIASSSRRGHRRRVNHVSGKIIGVINAPRGMGGYAHYRCGGRIVKHK